MSSLADKLARARETAAKATPGPLESNQHGEVRAVALDRLSIGFFSQSLSCGRNGSYVVTPDQQKANAALAVLAVNALTALLDVAEAADRVHRAYLACCNEETACDADTDNFHGAAINLDAALARLSEVL